MLRGIRKASANWLGKIVMIVVVGFLAFSFAVWGVGDIFRGGGQTAVASVGSQEISVEEFRQIYNDRLQQIGRQVGQPIRMEQARALGLDRQILGQLISERALDEWARRMGLGISDEAVAEMVRSIPAFHDANGQFDHALFLARIRDAGYTEQRFIAEQRRLMVRQHLTESIGGVTVAPRPYVDALNSFQNEERAIDYVALGAGQAGSIPEPAAEALAAYFEARKALFRAPEYRRLVLLRLSHDDIAKWIQVSDEEVRQAYESRRDRYTEPGRRHVQQILFPDEASAREARQRIEKGASFEEVASARGLSKEDFDFGLVTREAFELSPAVGDAAFSLPEGGVSEPVRSQLGFTLVRVVKIEPDRVRPFAEVAEEIRRELAVSRARNEMNDRHDRIEDERAAGATLAEAAQKAGLAVIEIDAVDRAGRDPGGAPVPTLPREVDLLTAAFQTDVGVEADALRLPEGGYLWFEVAGVTPSRERTLDEVRDQVAARWRADQVGERLKAKAEAMLAKVKAGTSLAEVAAAEGLAVASQSHLHRNAPAEGLPASVVAAAFRTPKDQAGSVQGDTPEQHFLFRVTMVEVPPLDLATPQGTQVEQALRNALSEDLLRQYIVHIERTLGTTINAEALRRVAGGEVF